MLVAAVTLACLLLLRPASALTAHNALYQPPAPASAISATAARPQLTATVNAVTEGSTLVYSITVKPPMQGSPVVEYAFVGDVSALVDAKGGRGAIPAGEALIIERRTIDDSLVNGDRHVVLIAGTPSLKSAQSDKARARASGLVRDNDALTPPPPPPAALPRVAISGASTISEGRTLIFPLMLSKPADQPVIVFYRLDDPDGVSADPTSGFATIAPGETAGVIEIRTTDDGAVNSLRAVQVQLVAARSASLGKPLRAKGMVADNDVAAPPLASYSVTVAEPEVAEGTALTFTVTRSGDLSQPGAISYSRTTAVEGRTGLPVRKTVEFPPQVASRSFDFNPDGPILHDMLVQVVLLQNDGEPQLSKRLAQGTIMDDPAIPAIAETVTPTETDSGMATEIGPTGPANPTERPIDNRAWYDPIDLGWPFSLIPIVVLVCGTAAAIWWLKPDPDPISDPEPIPDPIPDPVPPPPPVPDCEIGCTPRWGASQEPSSIGPLTLPELHFNIRAVPGEPTTPFALGATFLEERDEPDDQL